MGSAKGSPNWNGPEQGGCSPTGVTSGKSKGPWGWQWSNNWWWGSGFQKEEGMKVLRAHAMVLKPHHLTLDVGWILSMLMARLRMGTPHINTVSGDATPREIGASFEQCYHEVWCIKGHYPEAVVWESIIQSLNGATVDMARYMGPTASVDHILHKLSVILAPWLYSMCSCKRWARGIIKRFPFLPQGWRDPQPNSAPLPMEDDRLRVPTAPQGLPLPWGEETYPWLCLVTIQHPQHIIFPADDRCPKSGEWKWGSQDWERVRAAVTTKPVEGMAKLKHQITQLMAVLTQTGQGNGHTSTLSHPQECGHWCGCCRGGSSSHLDSYNSRSDPGQMTIACSLLTECVGEDEGRRTHMTRECLALTSTLNQSEGIWGSVAHLPNSDSDPKKQ